MVVDASSMIAGPINAHFNHDARHSEGVTNMRNVICIATVVVASFVGFATHAAQGLDYPTRPIRLIVPFVAGGSGDVLSRILGQWLSPQYGQQVVVENRPGSGGHVGAMAAPRAPPHGYTLPFSTLSLSPPHT